MRKTALLAIVLSLALAAPIALAAGGKYKGKTEHNRPISFKVSKGKVKSFEAGINIFCIGSGVRFDAVIPPLPMKVRKGGKFSYKGLDKVATSTIEIKGKVKGKKGSGTISMSNSQYNSSTQSFSGCTGKAKFKVKRK
jgi:hypothetical protein